MAPDTVHFVGQVATRGQRFVDVGWERWDRGNGCASHGPASTDVDWSARETKETDSKSDGNSRRRVGKITTTKKNRPGRNAAKNDGGRCAFYGRPLQRAIRSLEVRGIGSAEVSVAFFFSFRWPSIRRAISMRKPPRAGDVTPLRPCRSFPSTRQLAGRTTHKGPTRVILQKKRTRKKLA